MWVGRETLFPLTMGLPTRRVRNAGPLRRGGEEWEGDREGGRGSEIERGRNGGLMILGVSHELRIAHSYF